MSPGKSEHIAQQLPLSTGADTGAALHIKNHNVRDWVSEYVSHATTPRWAQSRTQSHVRQQRLWSTGIL